MKSGAVVALLLSSAAAWVVPPPLAASAPSPDSNLPACGVDSPHPCSCPEGTSYLWVQTYFSWGANAWSVRNLTGNFSDLSWVPQPIKKTIGPDNTVGSFRLTTVALDVGMFDWFEEITEYTTKDDGSFSWAFELKNVPIEFKFQGQPNRIEGEWERFEARAVSEHQTDIYWTLYGCHTGGTHSFPVFQQYCAAHVEQTLTEMGVHKGITTKPFSDIKIGHRDGALVKPQPSSVADNQFAFEQAQQSVLARKGVRMEM